MDHMKVGSFDVDRLVIKYTMSGRLMEDTEFMFCFFILWIMESSYSESGLRSSKPSLKYCE